ncbi:MAG: hypothetical protein ACRBEE_12420 [Arenicella sp.]
MSLLIECVYSAARYKNKNHNTCFYTQESISLLNQNLLINLKVLENQLSSLNFFEEDFYETQVAIKVVYLKSKGVETSLSLNFDLCFIISIFMEMKAYFDEIELFIMLKKHRMIL